MIAAVIESSCQIYVTFGEASSCQYVTVTSTAALSDHTAALSDHTAALSDHTPNDIGPAVARFTGHFGQRHALSPAAHLRKRTQRN